MRYLAVLTLFLAAPASAVPPPPPLPEAVDATQAIIRALTVKDFAAYEKLLSDGFVGYKNDGSEQRTREAWLREMAEAFSNPVFSVTIRHVFSGGRSIDGVLRQQVMLVENVRNYPARGNGIPGDCCEYYLTETITFDGGKVMRIDRSPLYDTQLSNEGRRTDLGPKP